MQQGGFLDAKPRHPIGMGGVIAAHIAVLGAIILAPPDYIKDRIKDFPLIPITEPKDPPPRDMVKPNKPVKQTDHVTRTDPIVRTQPKDSTETIALVDPHPVKPMDPPVFPPPPTVPDPVIVQARPNMNPDAMQPPYPAALARAEIEGKAEIRVLIGTDGRVKQVEQVSATDPGFFEATKQQALRRWRFTPATRDGVPIESWRTMTVRFQLQA